MSRLAAAGGNPSTLPIENVKLRVDFTFHWHILNWESQLVRPGRLGIIQYRDLCAKMVYVVAYDEHLSSNLKPTPRVTLICDHVGTK